MIPSEKIVEMIKNSSALDGSVEALEELLSLRELNEIQIAREKVLNLKLFYAKKEIALLRRWRKYPEETPEKLQRALVSLDGRDPFIVSYNAHSWVNYEFETLRWLPVPELNHEV